MATDIELGISPPAPVGDREISGEPSDEREKFAEISARGALS